MSFDTPWLLALLPLALLPLVGRGGPSLAAPSLALFRRDRVSRLVDLMLRLAGALAIGATLAGIAGPHRPEVPVERSGRGAEIVLLLDRSRSMDQGFGGGAAPGAAVKGTGPEALDYYVRRAQAETHGESKGRAARRLLAEFAAARPQDRYGLVVFSSLPMPVLQFTQKQEVIQAAIAAGDIGRGLSETDIGLALQAALRYFEDRAYTGSRVVMLVSDGGDHLTPDARAFIAELARRHRVGLTWIYLRSARSPGLHDTGQADAVPEVFLHRYFQTLGVPYRAYEAENPQALKRAMDDLSRLENLPITYQDILPRRDFDTACYALALAAVLLLIAAGFAELRQWR